MNPRNLDHPVYVDQGLIELIDIAVCSINSSKKSFIDVVISTKSTAVLDDKLLYHVKIHSSHIFDLLKEQKKNGSPFTNLCHLLKCMQKVEDESHLCVQVPDTEDCNMVLQSNYTAVDTDNSSVIKCSSTRQRKRKGQEGSNITLRVYQQRSTMILCCKKIHYFLRLLSFAAPQVCPSIQIHITMSLRIQDYNCHFEFENLQLFQTAEGHNNVCSNANYILRNSPYQAVKPCLVPHSGDLHTLPGVHITQECTSDVRIQAVACVISCRWQQQLSSFLMMSVYGPHRLPLLCRADDLNFILHSIPWSDYCFLPSYKDKTKMNLDADTVLCLQDLTTHRRCHYCIVLYLFIEHVDPEVAVGNWLRDHHNSFLHTYSREISGTVCSAIARALTFRAPNHKIIKCYTKAIPCISKSVSNVLLRSSNEEFRRKCFKMLNVENARLAENVMVDRLWQITKCCKGVVPPTSTGKNIQPRNCENHLASSTDPSQLTKKKIAPEEDSNQGVESKEEGEFIIQRYCTDIAHSKCDELMEIDSQAASLKQQSNFESLKNPKFSHTWDSQNDNHYDHEVERDGGMNCFSDLSNFDVDQIPDSTSVKAACKMFDQTVSDSQKNYHRLSQYSHAKTQDYTDISTGAFFDMEEQREFGAMVNLPIDEGATKESQNMSMYMDAFGNEMSTDLSLSMEGKLKKKLDHPNESDSDQWFEDVLMEVDNWLCED